MPPEPNHIPIKFLPETQQALLTALKQSQPATIGALTEGSGLSYETIRQHIARLEALGWIDRQQSHDGAAGRPEGLLRLTTDGEQLFAKAYDELAVALIDTVADRFGSTAMVEVLSTIADAKVAEWAPKLEGKGLSERLEILKDLYSEHDPYTEVTHTDDGPVLVENNCPYHAVAMARPALCSLTVSVLSRLLGYQVKRECSFQKGDGCCTFKVQQNKPIEIGFRFALEEQPDSDE